MIGYRDSRPARQTHHASATRSPLWGGGALDDAWEFGSNQDQIQALSEPDGLEGLDASHEAGAVDAGTAEVSARFHRILEDTSLFRLDDEAPVDTRHQLLAGEIAREATPPGGGERTRDAAGTSWEYLCGPTGLFGWVDAEDSAVVDAALVGDAADVDSPDTEGQGAIDAADQGQMLVMRQNTAVYADDLQTPIGKVCNGELVYPLGEQRKRGKDTFASLRMLSGDVGWVTSGALNNAKNNGSLGLDEVETAGSWVSGYAMSASANPYVLLGDSADATNGRKDAEQGSVYADPDGAYGTASFRLARDAAVDVLCDGGAPITRVAAGQSLVYVRASSPDGANLAGWVPEGAIKALDGVEQTEVGLLDELRQLCPNGISVCFVAQYQDVPEEGRQQFSTFLSEATAFAQQSGAVAIAGGQLVTGAVNLIGGYTDILGTLNNLQAALRDKDGKVPAWARVSQLALFAHGGWSGLSTGMDAGGEDSYDGDLYDSTYGNLKGFAKSLSAFVTGDVSVSFFACRTGGEPIEGGDTDEDGRGGEGGFAEQMQEYLVEAGVDDASVMDHFSSGPTIRNPDIRVFGGAGEDGSEQGGRDLFAAMMDGAAGWLGAPLRSLQRFMGLEPAAALAFLKPELYAWYCDTIYNDTQLAARMGTDPGAAIVELRTRAVAWATAMTRAWGVVAPGTAFTLDRDMNLRHLKGGRLAYEDIPLKAGLRVTASDASGAVCHRVAEDGRWYLSVSFEGAPAGLVTIIPMAWLTEAPLSDAGPAS